MEQKHFVVVSTEGGKLNMGTMQHNQSTWLNNLNVTFVMDSVL